MTSRAKSITTVLSIAITVLILVLTAFVLDWSLALRTLATADIAWLCGALTLFAINYGLRTMRFAVLLNLEANHFRQLLTVTTLHGLLNYLLPAKSGELSYVVLCKKHLRTPVAHSAATLIAARFFDFGVIAILLPITLFQFYAAFPVWLMQVSVAYCAVVTGAAAALVLYLRSTQDTERQPPARWWQRVAGVIVATTASLREIDRRRQYFKLWLLTFGIWGCVLMNYYCITASLGFEPALSQMLVISIILIPLSLIPVQGIANLGTHEAGWIAAFSLFGYSFDSALTLAVTSHVVLFLMFCALGVVGFGLLRTNANRPS